MFGRRSNRRFSAARRTPEEGYHILRFCKLALNKVNVIHA
jgi:hypothetical protein